MRTDHAARPLQLSGVMSPRRLLVLAFAALQLTACASTIDGITQRSTRSSTQVVVDEMTDKQTQDKIANNLDEAALEELSRRVAANAVDGAVVALEDPERRARVAHALEGVALPTGIAKIDDREVAEAVQTAMATSMGAMGEIDRAKVRGLVHDVVDEAVRTAFRTAREETQGFDPNTAIGAAAREIGKQASLGFQDAVDETARREKQGLIPDGESAVLLAAAQAAERYNTWTIIAMSGLAAVALALIVLAVLFWRRSRVQRAELEQRDEALLLVTEAMQENDGRPWSPELRDALSASIRDQARREEARRLLREHRESRNPTAPEASSARPAAAAAPRAAAAEGPSSRRRPAFPLLGDGEPVPSLRF